MFDLFTDRWMYTSTQPSVRGQGHNQLFGFTLILFNLCFFVERWKQNCKYWFLLLSRYWFVYRWLNVYVLRKVRIGTISGIVLRKVGILTLSGEVGILTLRRAIPELLVCKVGIRTKWEYLFVAFVISCLIKFYGTFNTFFILDGEFQQDISPFISL